MAAGYPSGTNTYVPNHGASQALIVGYSRNPKKFRVSNYVQYVRSKNNVGLFLVWTSQEGARVLTVDDAESLWADGDAAPQGENNLESMSWQPFRTFRRCYPFKLGQMAIDQASFPIVAAHQGESAQRCMTSRTLRNRTALANASWGSNTAAVDGGILPSGHNWTTGNNGEGTNQGPNIKLSLQYASKIVNIATFGTVEPSQLSLVINPATAQAMAASTEIQDYIKQSPFALAQLRGDAPNQNGKWDLPDVLYSHPVEVDQTVRVSSRKGANSLTSGYVIPDGEAYLVAREGELDGIEGSRSFSTVQFFFYKDEMTTYTKYDPDNERTLGRVVANDSPVVVSVLSGFRFTTCLG